MLATRPAADELQLRSLSTQLLNALRLEGDRAAIAAEEAGESLWELTAVGACAAVCARSREFGGCLVAVAAWSVLGIDGCAAAREAQGDQEKGGAASPGSSPLFVVGKAGESPPNPPRGGSSAASTSGTGGAGGGQRPPPSRERIQEIVLGAGANVAASAAGAPLLLEHQPAAVAAAVELFRVVDAPEVLRESARMIRGLVSRSYEDSHAESGRGILLDALSAADLLEGRMLNMLELSLDSGVLAQTVQLLLAVVYARPGALHRLISMRPEGVSFDQSPPDVVRIVGQLLAERRMRGEDALAGVDSALRVLECVALSSSDAAASLLKNPAIESTGLESSVVLSAFRAVADQITGTAAARVVSSAAIVLGAVSEAAPEASARVVTQVPKVVPSLSLSLKRADGSDAALAEATFSILAACASFVLDAAGGFASRTGGADLLAVAPVFGELLRCLPALLTEARRWVRSRRDSPEEHAHVGEAAGRSVRLMLAAAEGVVGVLDVHGLHHKAAEPSRDREICKSFCDSGRLSSKEVQAAVDMLRFVCGSVGE